MEAAAAAASSFAWRLFTLSLGVPSEFEVPTPAAIFLHHLELTDKVKCVIRPTKRSSPG
jgi:hypothetical protein